MADLFILDLNPGGWVLNDACFMTELRPKKLKIGRLKR
jgi:hypothetical protein